MENLGPYERSVKRLTDARKSLRLALSSGYLLDRADWTPPIDARTRVKAAVYLLDEAIRIQKTKLS